MENLGYYAFVLAAFIVGFIVVKRVASCLIKSIVTIVLVVILVAVYYLYVRQ